jgi:hypothetical protein
VEEEDLFVKSVSLLCDLTSYIADSYGRRSCNLCRCLSSGCCLSGLSCNPPFNGQRRYLCKARCKPKTQSQSQWEQCFRDRVRSCNPCVIVSIISSQSFRYRGSNSLNQQPHTILTPRPPFRQPFSILVLFESLSISISDPPFTSEVSSKFLDSFFDPVAL